MKLKAIDAVASAGALQRVNAMQLPLTLALLFKQNQKVLMEVSEEYNKRRQALIDALGTPHPTNPNVFNIPKKDLPEFQEKETALGQEELNLNLRTVEISRFDDSFTIAPNDLLILEWMITDDSSEPAPKKK